MTELIYESQTISNLLPTDIKTKHNEFILYLIKNYVAANARYPAENWADVHYLAIINKKKDNSNNLSESINKRISACLQPNSSFHNRLVNYCLFYFHSIVDTCSIGDTCSVNVSIFKFSVRSLKEVKSNSEGNVLNMDAFGVLPS